MYGTLDQAALMHQARGCQKSRRGSGVIKGRKVGRLKGLTVATTRIKAISLAGSPARRIITPTGASLGRNESATVAACLADRARTKSKASTVRRRLAAVRRAQARRARTADRRFWIAEHGREQPVRFGAINTPKRTPPFRSFAALRCRARLAS